MFPTILLVDDEASIIRTLKGLLSDEGYDVLTASNGYEALKIIDSESPDLALLDIWMPGIDGIETLKEIKKTSPHVQVIVITGHGSIETAVQTIKLGAYDLIEKPLSIEKVIVAINNALNFKRLEEENRYLRGKALKKHSIDGHSPVINELRKQVAVIAPSDSWIFVKGENGTGKELVARTIHQLSPRAEEPIVEVNCAAIPDELIETELFGQERGAFSSSTVKKRGKFELANKGTIFLDEISDMSLKNQAKILRALQERKIQRVGGTRVLDIDLRVITASNKDMEKEIEAGNFREDLYYRLNVIPITVPPLRDRIEDIPILMDTFFNIYARENRSRKKKVAPEALDLLMGYRWPGNVRELKNLAERLVIMVGKETIEAGDIPAEYRDGGAAGHSPVFFPGLFEGENLKEAKRAFEKEFIHRKLKENDHNFTRTAKIIGVARSYLHKKVKSLK
ncbi:Regulatory protein AtoC [Candidatus Desulfarcum epimagneticum]|uniref:Regulatory protein AtoC n=1 Tax=uncultured Desulfobacteraceae bacterium TaxID=218296 RepID=A0A484HH44_9BACT|nr:Regulatory protein AtoC [uncultured Desulfobacteraceae bacterium]